MARNQRFRHLCFTGHPVENFGSALASITNILFSSLVSAIATPRTRISTSSEDQHSDSIDAVTLFSQTDPNCTFKKCARNIDLQQKLPPRLSPFPRTPKPPHQASENIFIHPLDLNRRRRTLPPPRRAPRPPPRPLALLRHPLLAVQLLVRVDPVGLRARDFLAVVQDAEAGCRWGRSGGVGVGACRCGGCGGGGG